MRLFLWFSNTVPGFEMNCWILKLWSSDFILGVEVLYCSLLRYSTTLSFTNDASWLMLLPYLVMPAKHDKKRARVAKELGCKPIGGPTWLPVVCTRCPKQFRIRTEDFAKKPLKITKVQKTKKFVKFVYIFTLFEIFIFCPKIVFFST